jgi:hypothetical protein
MVSKVIGVSILHSPAAAQKCCRSGRLSRLPPSPGSQRGALSLSTITARTPSAKSGRVSTRAAMRYSITMLSAKGVAVQAVGQLAQRDLAGLGRFGLQRGEFLGGPFALVASRLARMSSKRSEAKCLAIRVHWPRSALRAVWRKARSAPVPLPPGRSGPWLRPALRAADSAWQGPPTCIPPRRAARRSAPERPIRPGRRDRYQPPPTSGNRPMPVSGMAKRVFSVATRKLRGLADAHAAAHGDPVHEGDHRLGIVIIRWLSWYSSWKNCRPETRHRSAPNCAGRRCPRPSRSRALRHGR